MPSPLIQAHGVVKDFGGLRPLRIQQFELHEGQRLALTGVDGPMAEVLVNLLTGATLPDAGAITVFGELTSAISDAQAWVRTLDQFGLISERAVVLDQLTAEQNLALPLSLRIESMPADVRTQVRVIGDEVGLSPVELSSPVASLSPLARQRLRFGRALALNPRVVLAEHPNAPLSVGDTRLFAAVLAQVVAARGIASLVITADKGFAAAASEQVLALQPASGLLQARSGWRGWW